MLRRALGASIVLLAYACSEAASAPPNALPSRADGGADEEDFSAGVSIQCPALEGRVDVVRTSLDDLDEKGGPIADGRWVLTASALVDDETDAGPVVVAQKAAAFAFAGNEVAWASDTDVFGTPKSDCCRGRYAVDGSELTLEVRCNGGNEAFVLAYGVDAMALRIRTSGNEYVDTYARR
jgi:hypothetical protein